ncbi:unnamed protein product, partial [Cyprideis torosa]
ILFTETLQCTEASSSPAMEVIGFHNSLEEAKEAGEIHSICTDRHPAVVKKMNSEISNSESVLLGELDSYSSYVVFASAGNFYTKLLSRKPDKVSSPVTLNTTGAPPPPPSLAEVRVLSPKEVSVSWYPPSPYPLYEVEYQVVWRSANVVTGEKKVKGSTPALPPLPPPDLFPSPSAAAVPVVIQATLDTLVGGLEYEIHVRVLSPKEVSVSWYPPSPYPLYEVEYQVVWRSANVVTGEKKVKGSTPALPPLPPPDLSPSPSATAVPVVIQATLDTLVGGLEYEIHVRAFSIDGTTFSESEVERARTFDPPEEIRLLPPRQTRTLELSWNSPGDGSVLNHTVHFTDVGTQIFTEVQPLQHGLGSATRPAFPYRYSLRGLRPSNKYGVRMEITYTETIYLWPEHGNFVFETLPDRPETVGFPKVVNLRAEVFQVTWAPAINNGEFVDWYLLDKQISGESDWETVYNGTDNFWVIRGLDPDIVYSSVSAHNALGLSDPSKPSRPFSLEAAVAGAAGGQTLVLGVTVGAVVVLVALLGGLLCYVSRRRLRQKKAYGGLGELVSLPRLPPHLRSEASNQLYQGPLLPHVRKEHIRMTKYLGGGAFGDTLRTGATDVEKTQFMKEAELMSQFKHEHILQLLG